MTVIRPAEKNLASSRQRFASVDVLRGLAVAAMLLVNNPGDWSHVYSPLLHSGWNGFTPTDLIFPLFLFVVGVSIALGVSPRIVEGQDRAAALSDVWMRALRIVALGLLLHLIAYWTLSPPEFRPWGVLQRIGLCFGIASTLSAFLGPRTQMAVIVTLLLGYWITFALFGGYAPESNPASRLDSWMLGAHAYHFDAASGRGHDPEGLLSTLPALATTLLGVRAGDWLANGHANRLPIIGIAALIVGAACSPLMPINKNLWTSSYVLWSGGWALLLLWICHVVIDRWRWQPICRSFGINAISAYVGSALMIDVLIALGWLQPLYQTALRSWIAPRLGESAASLAFALAFTTLWWLIAYAMKCSGWRLRA